MKKVEKHMLSRLLYCNPVCLLTVCNQQTVNVMTVSWLTCINNQGVVFLSIKDTRFTAKMLEKSFTLSIPTTAMRSKVLEIGSVSGAEGCKITRLGLELVNTDGSVYSRGNPCIQGCCAYLDLQVLQVNRAHGHCLITAQIIEGFAKESHWNGRNLYLKDDLLLKFMGSKVFGCVEAL